MLSALTNDITSLVGSLGLPGVLVLCAISCACIPLPSEVVMLFAGFEASRGRYGLAAVVLVGTLGSVLGSQLAYALGRSAHVEAFVRGLPHGERSLARAQRFFGRYGEFSVLALRLVPFVRAFISLPAGLARMPFWRFSALTLIGCVPYALGFAVLGHAVGANWKALDAQLRYGEYAVLACCAAALVFAAHRARRRHQ